MLAKLSQQPNDGEELRDINKHIEVAFALSTHVPSLNEAFSAKSEQRVRACYCAKTDRGFAIIASADFALLYRFGYSGLSNGRLNSC